MSYDVIPPNYPSGSTNKEIGEAILELQKEIAGNSRVESIVVNRSTLIQLGQTELSGRFTKKTSIWSLGISIMSLLFSFLAIYLAIKGNLDTDDWKQKQLEVLQRIEMNLDKKVTR